MKFLFTYFLLLIGSMPVMEVCAQTKPCIFCEIATGKVQERQTVYYNGTVAAFLSHGPDNPGHLLIVPVKHAVQFTDIPDSSLAEMMALTKRLIEAIKKTDIRADAFRIMMNSGKAAGQSVMHAHFHLIPRYAGEVLNTEHKISSPEELEAVADKIRKAL